MIDRQLESLHTAHLSAQLAENHSITSFLHIMYSRRTFGGCIRRLRALARSSLQDKRVTIITAVSMGPLTYVRNISLLWTETDVSANVSSMDGCYISFSKAKPSGGLSDVTWGLTMDER